jgi:hypothetical protein
MLASGDLGELWWRAGREETDHRRRAMERASRASRFWSEEVHEIAESGRPLTDLNAVGHLDSHPDPGMARGSSAHP